MSRKGSGLGFYLDPAKMANGPHTNPQRDGVEAENISRETHVTLDLALSSFCEPRSLGA